MSQDGDSRAKDARFGTAGRLVRGAVHDIKSPVGFVSGNLSYLQQTGGQVAERIEALRQHTGPYAQPGELREAVMQLLEFVDREGEELRDCVAECIEGMAQIDAHARALASVAHDNPQVQRVGLDELIHAAAGSARLYGRHMAHWDLQVGPRQVELPRQLVHGLLVALLVEPLEACPPRSTGWTVRVFDRQGVVIEDDCPQRPLSPRAVVLASELGWSLERRRQDGLNLTAVRGL